MSDREKIPGFMALRDETAWPSGVRGPVEWRASAAAAAIWAALDIGILSGKQKKTQAQRPASRLDSSTMAQGKRKALIGKLLKGFGEIY
jgi:hypothetical protein